MEFVELVIVYVMMDTEVKTALKDLFIMEKYLRIMWFAIKIGMELIATKNYVKKTAIITEFVKMAHAIAMTVFSINYVRLERRTLRLNGLQV